MGSTYVVFSSTFIPGISNAFALKFVVVVVVVVVVVDDNDDDDDDDAGAISRSIGGQNM